MSPRAQSILETHAGTLITIIIVIATCVFNYGSLNERITELKTSSDKTTEIVTEIRVRVARIEGRQEAQSRLPKQQTSFAQIK